MLNSSIGIHTRIGDLTGIATYNNGSATSIIVPNVSHQLGKYCLNIVEEGENEGTKETEMQKKVSRQMGIRRKIKYSWEK